MYITKLAAAAARARRGGPCGRTHNIGLGPEVVHLLVNYEPANCERRCFGRGEEDDIPMNRSVGVFVRHRCHAPVIDIRAVTPRRFYMGSRPYNATAAAAAWDGPNFSAGTSVRRRTLSY